MKNYSMISYQKQHLEQLNLYHTFYFLDRIDDDEINLRVHVSEENERYSARYLVPVESYKKLVAFLENVDLEKEAAASKANGDRDKSDLNKEWLDFEMEDGKAFQITSMNEYLRQIPDMMKEIEAISGEPLYRNPRLAAQPKKLEPTPQTMPDAQEENQDFWICPNCGKKLTRQFCFACGTSRTNSKPLIVTAPIDDEPWICPTCGKECHGNFCMICGTSKVVAPEAGQAEMESELDVEQEAKEELRPLEEWTCPACGHTCTENFCMVCGMEKPQEQPVETEMETETVEEAPQAVGQTQQAVEEPAEQEEIEPWECPVCGAISTYIFCICCGALNPDMENAEPETPSEEEDLPDGMWRCPYCNTINEGEICAGCGWESEKIDKAEDIKTAVQDLIGDPSVSDAPEMEDAEVETTGDEAEKTEEVSEVLQPVQEETPKDFGFAVGKLEEDNEAVSIESVAMEETATEDETESNDDTWTCLNCGNLNIGIFCAQCGIRKPGQEHEPVIYNTDSMLWYCPNCGAENRKRFCGDCGTVKPD